MATLTLSSTSVQQGGILSFTYTGFLADELIYYEIFDTSNALVGSSYGYANSSGSGSGSIRVNNAPATYILRVRNSDYATPHILVGAYFIVTGATYNPTISVSPSSVPQGSTINVSYAGFPGNILVTLTNVQTGGYWTLSTTASGSGTWSGLGPVGDAPGTYTLRAVDSAGHTATTTFTITAVAAWVAITTVSATVAPATSASWTEITKVEATVPAASAVWTEVTKVEGIIAGTTVASWTEITKIEAAVAGETTYTWTAVTSVETMVAAAAWAVVNNIEAAVMVADAYSWTVMTTVAAMLKVPGGGEEPTGTNWTPWLIGGAALATLALVASQSKKAPIKKK